MPESFRRPLFIAAIVAIALILRLALLRSTGFAGDIAVFDTWASVLATHGPGAIYGPSVTPHVDYSPGYLYVLWAIGIARGIVDPTYSHAVVFRVLLKLPDVIADFEAAALGYAIVRRFASQSRAIAVLCALLIGPVFWLDSAFWGQADTIACALLFGAILLRLQDRASLAWIVLAVAVFVKPQGVVLIPLFAVRFFARGNSWWTLGRAALSVVGLSYLATLPFTTERSPFGVLRFLVERYLNGVAKAPHGSEGAFNLYTIFGPFFQSDARPFAGVPLHTWSIALTVAALVSIAAGYARMVRTTSDIAALDRAFVYASALSLAALFFLGTRMHERYLLPGLACATLVAFDSLGMGLAVAALTVSFAINVAIIVAGFSGGAHHPQVVVVGHVFSAVNLVALAVVARNYAMQTRPRTSRA